jgi:hypothetical protein
METLFARELVAPLATAGFIITFPDVAFFCAISLHSFVSGFCNWLFNQTR